MNQDILSGKWKEIKGEVRKAWGKLTDDEVEQTKGNFDSISGLVQQKYGYAKDDANGKVNQWLEQFDEKMKKTSPPTDSSRQKI